MTTTPPRGALWLGYAGLLPAAAAFLVLLAGPDIWAPRAIGVHLIYAATIASFVGGAWWGLASARAPEQDLTPVLAVSVMPSLLAWGFALLGGRVGLIGLGLLFLALVPVDLRLARAGLAPSWWLTLRRPLSIGMALLALGSALAAG